MARGRKRLAVGATALAIALVLAWILFWTRTTTLAWRSSSSGRHIQIAGGEVHVADGLAWDPNYSGFDRWTPGYSTWRWEVGGYNGPGIASLGGTSGQFGGLVAWFNMPGDANAFHFVAWPLVPMIAVPGLAFVAAAVPALRRSRRLARGLCAACAYDRRGLPPGSPCAECGALPEKLKVEVVSAE
jgi:hypothetical protein